MFNKKSKRIQELDEEVVNTMLNSKVEKRELMYNFISILDKIQEKNNENLQWKARQKAINEEIDSTIEKYRDEIMKL